MLVLLYFPTAFVVFCASFMLFYDTLLYAIAMTILKLFWYV